MPSDCNLLEALAIYNLTEQVFAIAIDAQIIPRSMYAHVRLKNSNNIDIIVPMQGG